LSNTDYQISQYKGEGEISLITGDDVQARISLQKSQIYEIMKVGGSKPHEFIQTLAKLVEIGYYEPLGSWSIKLGEF
jgi:hypothetical protein